MEVPKTTLDSERCEGQEKKIKNAKKRLELVVKDKDSEKKASAYDDLAWSYYYVGDYKQSITYGEKLQKISEKMGHKKREANAYHVLAWAYKDYRDYEKSETCGREFLRISGGLNDTQLKLSA